MMANYPNTFCYSGAVKNNITGFAGGLAELVNSGTHTSAIID
jgi:hypothetical protein